MNRIVFFVVFLMWTIRIVSQNTIMDSLKNAFDKTNNDSLKWQLCNQLFPFFIKQNIDSASKCLRFQDALLNRLAIDTLQKQRFLVNFYNNSGIYYNRMGQQDSSIYFYKKALSIAMQSDKQNMAGTILNNIANIYYLQGNYKAALEYHLQALSIRKKNADTNGIAMSYGNIGLIHAALKQYDKSIDYYQKAERLFELLKDKASVSWAYRAIGVTYLDLKQYRQALTNLFHSLDICKEIADLSGEKYGLLNVAMVYLGLYDSLHYDTYLDSAEQALEEVVRLQKTTYSKRIEINYLNLKSQLLIKRGHYAKALNLLNKSENLLKDIDLKTELKDVYQFKSEIYEKENNYREALYYYKRFKWITDSLFSLEKEKEIGRKEAEFEYKEQLKIRELKAKNKLKLEIAEKQKLKLWLIIIVLISIIIVGIFVVIFQRLTAESRLLRQQKNQILKKYNNIEEAYNKAITNIEKLQQQPSITQLPHWATALSKREMEVLSCLAVGMTDKEISEKLFISVTTVRTHCRRIYGKLLVKNRMEAVHLARKYNLI